MKSMFILTLVKIRILMITHIKICMNMFIVIHIKIMNMENRIFITIIIIMIIAIFMTIMFMIINRVIIMLMIIARVIIMLAITLMITVIIIIIIPRSKISECYQGFLEIQRHILNKIINLNMRKCLLEFLSHLSPAYQLSYF